MNNLRQLHAAGAAIDDAAAVVVSSWLKLEAIELNRPALTDAGFQRLAKLPRLQHLSINHGTNITKAGVEALSQSKSLQELSLSNAREAVTDDVISPLKNWKSLKMLWVPGTKVTEPALRQLSQALPNCRIIWDKGELGPKVQ